MSRRLQLLASSSSVNNRAMNTDMGWTTPVQKGTMLSLRFILSECRMTDAEQTRSKVRHFYGSENPPLIWLLNRPNENQDHNMIELYDDPNYENIF
ncbi:hypothetical protein CEXT_721841 [Caerostris extrusa]|uniref:Uncharacterized protein n=1 Tax=Caerostris extrusa TaxID=172846 RepID=A0AAV4R4H8_CAEEX|nr:hypothetical protein CEXT_721841 [Caerostris extrusa]